MNTSFLGFRVSAEDTYWEQFLHPAIPALDCQAARKLTAADERISRTSVLILIILTLKLDLNRNSPKQALQLKTLARDQK